MVENRIFVSTRKYFSLSRLQHIGTCPWCLCLTCECWNMPIMKHVYVKTCPGSNMSMSERVHVGTCPSCGIYPCCLLEHVHVEHVNVGCWGVCKLSVLSCWLPKCLSLVAKGCWPPSLLEKIHKFKELFTQRIFSRIFLNSRGLLTIY